MTIGYFYVFDYDRFLQITQFSLLINCDPTLLLHILYSKKNISITSLY